MKYASFNPLNQVYRLNLRRNELRQAKRDLSFNPLNQVYRLNVGEQMTVEMNESTF